MLISKTLNDAINAEIGREFLASHQYIQIAAYFESESLHKMAELFYKQSDEEREHGMKFIKYVLEAGGEVVLPQIDAPQAKFSTAEEAVALALKWELDVTRHINDLMDIAVKEKDYLGQAFLNWFVTEQLEEVSSMDNLLKVVRKAGEKNLIMLEGYLSHKD